MNDGVDVPLQELPHGIKFYPAPNNKKTAATQDAVQRAKENACAATRVSTSKLKISKDNKAKKKGSGSDNECSETQQKAKTVVLRSSSSGGSRSSLRKAASGSGFAAIRSFKRGSKSNNNNNNNNNNKSDSDKSKVSPTLRCAKNSLRQYRLCIVASTGCYV